MVEQVAEEGKTTEGDVREEVLEEDSVKQFADASTETDAITELIIEVPVKTLVNVGTQTEPLVELTLESQRRNVALDHTYSLKPKQAVDPKNIVTKVEPDSLPVEDNLELSDESNGEWCDDVDDTGSVYSCDNSDDSDEDWNPDEGEDSDDESVDFFHHPSSNWLAENEESSNQSKSIVFDSCLKQLFQLCRICGATVKNAYLKQRGSLICATTVCKAGHTEPWFSQPFMKGMAAGNLICSGGILFTGNHFAKVSAVMSECNIRFFSKGTFYYIQRKYLWPVVNNHYLIQQREALQSLRGQPLVLAGDGRCDSPGHNAKYGTYSVMEVTTEKILDFSLVRVSEVANSNAMEKEGLKRCLEFLERDGQVIDLLATDRYLTFAHGKYLNRWRLQFSKMIHSADPTMR